MSKSKNKLTINADNVSADIDVLTELSKPVAITNAIIKDGMCNYGYEILTGPGKGDKIPNRKGSSYVHEDMINAFSQLNVHLAIIDEVFKYAKTTKTLDDMKDHEAVEQFSVTGIKVQGSDEDEGFILIGEKYVETGNIGLESPKIKSTSGYLFFDELKESISSVITEVEAYMDGKAAPKFEQTEMDFDTAAGNNDFENPID